MASLICLSALLSSVLASFQGGRWSLQVYNLLDSSTGTKRKVASLWTAAAEGVWQVAGSVCGGCLTLGQSLWPEKCTSQNGVACPRTQNTWGQKSGDGQKDKGGPRYSSSLLISFYFLLWRTEMLPKVKTKQKERLREASFMP